MKISYFVKCICISEKNVVFEVLVFDDTYGNLIGDCNIIVNDRLECDTERKGYKGFEEHMIDDAEKQCIKRARFIFAK